MESADMIDYRIDEHRLQDGDVVSAWALAAVCIATFLALVAVYIV